MPRTLVPVIIKPVLIPFLYQHFKTKERASINGKKIKSVVINTRDSLGKIIRLLASKTDQKAGCDKSYSIFLSLENTPRGKRYFGNIYKYESGEHSFLKLDEEATYLINKKLEEEMEQAMMFFIYGYHSKEGLSGIQKGIHLFAERYDLLEHGYDVESIRRTYYRWKNTIDQIALQKNTVTTK